MNWLKLISNKIIIEPKPWFDNIKSVRRINPEEKDAMQTIQNEHPFDWSRK